MYDKFYPGREWLDTEGKKIEAHGGSVLYENGVYYWYGASKEHADGKSGVWHWGVRCYASTDLYNWKDLGTIIPPDFDHRDSPLYPASQMDRPHILHNKENGRYVCWLKVMEENGQTETVLTSDHLTGPYRMVKTGLKPLNMYAGDFDLAAAPDGKAYYFFERVHSEMIVADLTADYTDVTGYYSTHFPHPYPPYVREAPAHFTRNGKQYLITSGTTGYLPNPSEVSVADTWHGPYTILGDPHPSDPSHTSFHSQISSVFRVAGKKDLYIACADRWLPNDMDLDYAVYSRVFDAIFSGHREKLKDIIEEFGLSRKQIDRMHGDAHRDTTVSTYVWLPLTFHEPDAYHPLGQVTISWRDSWSLDEFEDESRAQFS